MKFICYKFLLFVILAWSLPSLSMSYSCYSYFEKSNFQTQLERLATLSSSTVDTYIHNSSGRKVHIFYEKNRAIRKQNTLPENPYLLESLGSFGKSHNYQDVKRFDLNTYSQIRQILESLLSEYPIFHLNWDATNPHFFAKNGLLVSEIINELKKSALTYKDLKFQNQSEEKFDEVFKQIWFSKKIPFEVKNHLYFQALFILSLSELGQTLSAALLIRTLYFYFHESITSQKNLESLKIKSTTDIIDYGIENKSEFAIFLPANMERIMRKTFFENTDFKRILPQY